MTHAQDRAAIDAWWREFVATGALPAAVEPVQGRLVRAVGRGALPSGPVHVKVMTFPRAKDRLRYAFRALPGAHEARMLRAVAAAGIVCPDVVDVRTARRGCLPFRSLLVLRTLPVAAPPDPADPRERLREECEIALRLLAAGIVHRDLHRDNFVRLHDGRLAVLDLQSAHLMRGIFESTRLAVAARLLRDRAPLADDVAIEIAQRSGLVRGGSEAALMRERTAAARARYHRSRVLRCLSESTEFTKRLRWNGVEHRVRTGLGDGRWCAVGRCARLAWIGQRVLQLDGGRAPAFTGFFGKWWWFGGGGALYVPRACSDERIESEVQSAIAGFVRLFPTTRRPEGETL